MATDLDSFEAARKSSLREEDRVALQRLLHAHADVRTQEALQERLTAATRGTVQYAQIEREYVNWIARQVAMQISEQALQDAISSLGGGSAAVGEPEVRFSGSSKEYSHDEGKRK